MEKKKDSKPQRPLTPFFLFRQKEQGKGSKLGRDEAAEKWNDMSDSEKKPYVEEYRDARAKYDQYLEEVEGIPPRTSSRKKEKSSGYSISRMRVVAGKAEGAKEMSQECYKGLAKVVEAFMAKLGGAIADDMKAQDRRVLTVDGLTKVLERKEYGFLNSMEGYDKALRDADDATESEKHKRQKARSMRKGEKGDKEGEEEERSTKKRSKSRSKMK